MTYAFPAHTRADVDRAGEWLRRPPDEVPETALDVINNWRSSHQWPLLSVRITLTGRAKKVNKEAVVVQRLKRLPSIRTKLNDPRNSRMQLTQMQDIGGCRAILPRARQVWDIVRIFDKSKAKDPRDRPVWVKEFDYLTTPKPSGYRSFHLVYKFRSPNQLRMAHYKDLRIEIQLRSQLQHAWATAVETVSTFTKSALKHSIAGDDDWRRFFALMGSEIAFRENEPPVPGTPAKRHQVRNELKDLSKKINAEGVLLGLGTAVQKVTRSEMGSATTFLLILDAEGKQIQVSPYRDNQLLKADEDYFKVEKLIADNPGVEACLVSVGTVAELRSAYPNYYLDASAFLAVLREAISTR